MEDSMIMTNEDACLLACERLVIASYSLMDHGDYDGCAALFAPDALWVRGGKPVEGREAIRQSLDQRPASHATRHIVTNVLVRRVSEDEASATALFVPLRGPIGPEGLCGAPKVDAVGDLFYTFAKVEGEWKIRRLEPHPLFR